MALRTVDPHIQLGLRTPERGPGLGANILSGITAGQGIKKSRLESEEQSQRIDLNKQAAEELADSQEFDRIKDVYATDPQRWLQLVQSSTVFDDEAKADLAGAVNDPQLFAGALRSSNRILGGGDGIDPIEAEKLIIRREELAARKASDIERAAVQRETIAARKIADDQSRQAARQAIQAKITAAELSNDRKLITQAKIDTNKLNIKRIGELSQAAKGREEAIKKARQFRRQLSGENLLPDEQQRESGTTRTFMSFIPGVFSDQAAFDQKFNAFAEVAARQQLKAAGEIRPTDADVEGMKRAMFGIGRDESVNVQLLDEFITDQQNLDEELEDLREAKSQGRLNEFTGSQTATGELPPGAIDNGDGTFTLPTGEIIRRKR